jgi:transcription-repair coupling factor (superfamily II helicase)
VGFELYCQMLRESVRRLKGGAPMARAEVSLDCVRHADTPMGAGEADSDGALVAALPAEWIPDTRLRLESFRRVALAATREEVAELREELKDRFGRPPKEASALLDLADLRCLAASRGVTRLETEGATLRCHRVARGGGEEPVLQLGRFPRLTAREPLRKLAEIRAFLGRMPEFPACPPSS